ncbi:hypothetical protein INT47_005306 [Mucor saturninus]|uniref:Ubiquinol-cytochrome-c reductase complex assembly factor 2 n=1 Tax=Mucor saturninus TaxID=64648 RepID=A0A8H7V785_9FUNG|nr:hypothetical protein INT47_005306 [Mucor saturninus]
MSKPSQQEIHSLYRSYLRIVQEWPQDKLRPNRGMKQILAKKVKETFRQPHADINVDKARGEIKALEALLDNTFKNKVNPLFALLTNLSKQEQYPISDKILTPAGNPNYYSKLVTSLEATLETGKEKGILAKLFGK